MHLLLQWTTHLTIPCENLCLDRDTITVIRLHPLPKWKFTGCPPFVLNNIEHVPVSYIDACSGASKVQTLSGPTTYCSCRTVASSLEVEQPYCVVITEIPILLHTH